MIPNVSLQNLGERVRYWLTVGVSCVPPNRYRSIFVRGYPRTGPNWLCTMLSHYFDVPISEPWLRKTPAIHPVVLHLHRFAIVARRTIYMVRPPLDHENLPGFIRILFDPSHLPSIPLDRHLRKVRTLGLYTARYEDTLDRTSFEKSTGRKRGEEDVKAVVGRKGVAGDWLNHFTPEAARVFDSLAGDLLVESGYEPDRSWVERVADAPAANEGS